LPFDASPAIPAAPPLLSVRDMPGAAAAAPAAGSDAAPAPPAPKPQLFVRHRVHEPMWRMIRDALEKSGL